MSDETLAPPTSVEAARLTVGWEIVRASGIDKNDPNHVARVVGRVIQILRKAEAPQVEMKGDITVHALTPRDSSASPGNMLRLTYSFSGGPTTIPLVVFVHFYRDGGDGSPLWGDDHDPPKPTTAWSGVTSYTRDVVLPGNVPPGAYRIGLGLYDRNGTSDRLELKTAGGTASSGGSRYEVGTLKLG